MYQDLITSTVLSWLASEYATDIVATDGSGRPGTNQNPSVTTWGQRFSVATMYIPKIVRQSDVETMLSTAIGNGLVPGGDGNTIYAVHLPSHIAADDGSDDEPVEAFIRRENTKDRKAGRL